MENFTLHFNFMAVGQQPYPANKHLLLCDWPSGRLAFGCVLPTGELCLIGGQWQPTHFAVADEMTADRA